MNTTTNTTELTEARRIFLDAVRELNPTTEAEWQFVIDCLEVTKAGTQADGLKAARIKAGYTVPEAAEASGITSEALTAYETRVRTPRDSVKIKLAELYQMPVSALFF